MFLPFDLPIYVYYLIPVLQIICILHALKTNRRDWIYILLFLPGIGGIIYIIREMLPAWRSGGINGNHVQQLFPGHRIKALEKNLKIADTDANRLQLAREYAKQQNFEKAMALTSSCMKGIYANNADMMLDMGRYAFGAAAYTQSLQWLDKVLKAKKNRFERPEDELLYARALHHAGNTEQAEKNYQQFIRVHHSLQGRYHYSILLKEMGRMDEAKLQFKAVLEEKNLHPKHVRRINAQWVRFSRRELSALKK